MIAAALILVTMAMLGNAVVLLRLIRSLEGQRQQPARPTARGVLGNARVLLRVIRFLERQRPPPRPERPERPERPVLLAWPRDERAHRPPRRPGFIPDPDPDRSVERPRAAGELG